MSVSKSEIGYKIQQTILVKVPNGWIKGPEANNQENFQDLKKARIL